MNNYVKAVPLEPKISNLAAPLERIGEAVFFLSMVGDSATIATLAERPAPLMPFWWREIGESGRLYMAQYLRVPAGFDFILYPDWQKMSVPARAGLVERLQVAINKARETLSAASANQERGK